MAEEPTAIEEETTATSAPAEERKGSGPGFILGVALGMLAGAAAATLLAPATGEEFRHRAVEGESGTAGAPAGTTVERIRSVLDRVRARVQEASEEAQAAAREIEAQQRARYAELTSQEEPQP